MPRPYLLAPTLKFPFEKYRDWFSETYETILNSFWVDDLVGDASIAAYGCVIFLRGITHDIRVIVKFLCSKSIIAPLKSLTLPRLELLGYLLSARLSKQVSKCLKLEAKCYFYTNSNKCAYWIKSKVDNYKSFVKNRVREIQILTERDQWSHCPGKEKPADIPSRGIQASELAKNSLGWHGPP
ncbi:integrase catalytic domain-containing protein [Nephila pilipes]|uniref:Integrase catalytic domain-containing protein n=1 Tax=Nephila pilipes TaxID=299642 RepID=A0A8X6URC0_NEPPI|nr:integrase catalytic domain-containing protein [Nephila pilipes]